MRISDWSSDVCSSDLRCPACRARAQHPPRTIHCQGLEGAWPCSGDAGPVELPAGTTLVVPEDPTYETGLDRLVQRLAAAGFEQFVVPDDLAPAIALILAQSTAELGFVLGHEALRSEEQTYELKSLLRMSYDVFC